MEKKLYKFYYVIVLCVSFSCKNEIPDDITQKNDAKKAELIEKVVTDTTNFLKKETSEINNEGIKLIEKGQFKEAKKVFQKSLKIEPKNAVTYNNLALIATNEGDFDLANDYFKKAIYYDSAYYPAYINFSSLLIENDYFKRAITINDYVLKTNKNNEFELMANYFNTYAYLALKDCKQALIYCKNAKKNCELNKNIESSLHNLEAEIEKCLHHNL